MKPSFKETLEAIGRERRLDVITRSAARDPAKKAGQKIAAGREAPSTVEMNPASRPSQQIDPAFAERWIARVYNDSGDIRFDDTLCTRRRTTVMTAGFEGNVHLPRYGSRVAHAVEGDDFSVTGARGLGAAGKKYVRVGFSGQHDRRDGRIGRRAPHGQN